MHLCPQAGGWEQVEVNGQLVAHGDDACRKIVVDSRTVDRGQKCNFSKTLLIGTEDEHADSERSPSRLTTMIATRLNDHRYARVNRILRM